MREMVVVSAARTPFGKFGGLLRDFSAVDLGTMAVKSVMEKIDLDPTVVDELFMGVAVLAGTAAVAARQILFTTGLPPETPSLTIDRGCCSSVTGVGLAMRNILAGEIDTAIAGGMEAMSQTPLVARNVRWGARLGGIMLRGNRCLCVIPLLIYRLRLESVMFSIEYGFGRNAQDEWALRSHQRYFEAYDAGKILR